MIPECRLGFIVPSVNAIFETDCRRRVPDKFGIHVARATCARDTEEELSALARLAPVAACDLRDAGVTAIALACTSGSLLEGPEYDAALIKDITRVTGRPATTSAAAVRDALASVGAATVALVTPYDTWLNDRVAAYLAASGIATVAVHGFGMPDVRQHERLSPHVIADRAVQLATREDVDAVLLSCTSFPGWDAANLVRARLDLPVVASNEATIWAAARLVGEGDETYSALEFGNEQEGA